MIFTYILMSESETDICQWWLFRYNYVNNATIWIKVFHCKLHISTNSWQKDDSHSLHDFYVTSDNKSRNYCYPLSKMLDVNEMWQRHFVLPNTREVQSTVVLNLFYICLSTFFVCLSSSLPSLFHALSFVIMQLLLKKYICAIFPFHRLGVDIVTYVNSNFRLAATML